MCDLITEVKWVYDVYQYCPGLVLTWKQQNVLGPIESPMYKTELQKGEGQGKNVTFSTMIHKETGGVTGVNQTKS